MASNWTLTPIDELKAPKGGIAIGPFGSRMKSDRYVPVGVPVIRGNNIGGTRELVGEFVYIAPEFADTLGNAIVYADDLVFPHRGAIGQVGIVPKGCHERYALSTSLMKLTCDRDKAEPLFLFYFFRSNAGQHELLKNASTVGTPGIGQPLSTLKAIKVPLPPIATQKSIARLLSELDDRIALLRDTNRTLEDMARLLFRAWFVDFEPVRAKMEGRAPTSCDAATATLFPDRLVESQLVEIPEGWACAPISRYVAINDWTLSKKDKLDQIEYIEISEVSKSDINAVQSYARGDEPSRARRRLKHGDVALSTVRPDRGAYFLCLHPSESLIASTGFAVVTSKSVPWSYTYAALTLDEVSEHLGNRADGGAYPAVRPEVIGEWEVAAPESGDILEEFHALAAPMLERAHANRTLARTLAQSRDELLPRLMSGAIHVLPADTEADA